MYWSFVCWLLGCATMIGAAYPAMAQEHEHPAPAQGAPAPPNQVDHSQHEHQPGAASLFSTRESSGTAWIPELSPMYAIHGRAGGWELMAHGSAQAR